MAIKSYEWKSKIATAVSFIAAFIVYVGQDGLQQILPGRLGAYIPLIVLLAGYILTQGTENKRVATAEKMIEEQYTPGEKEQ